MAPHEVLALNSLRRLLELGPAVMRTIGAWSGFSDTQLSPGAIRASHQSMHAEPCSFTHSCVHHRVYALPGFEGGRYC